MSGGAFGGSAFNSVPVNGSSDGIDVAVAMSLVIDSDIRATMATLYHSPRRIVVPKVGCRRHTCRFSQTPDEVLDYDIELYRWLSDDDAVISAVATPTVLVPPIVTTVGLATDRVKVWISGGADGQSIKIEVLITTARGRVLEVCLDIRIRDCC